MLAINSNNVSEEINKLQLNIPLHLIYDNYNLDKLKDEMLIIKDFIDKYYNIISIPLTDDELNNIKKKIISNMEINSRYYTPNYINTTYNYYYKEM